MDRALLAKALVQFMNLAPTLPNTDFEYILKRAGVELPQGNTFTRDSFLSLVDDPSLMNRATRVARTKHTVHDPNRVPKPIGPGVPPR